jgi:hypothetical protein
VQLISEERALSSTSRPLAAKLPRSSGVEAEMCPGQRTLGSQAVPDNQTDHHGSYAWLWWLNGRDADGVWRWPDAESNVFAALGHVNGMRGMAVVPCLDVVLAWNDTILDTYEEDPHPLNEVFRLLYLAANTAPADPPVDVGPALWLSKEEGPGPQQATVRLDWSADLGARVGEHYHLFRGTTPVSLDLVEGTHPLEVVVWSEAVADPPQPGEPPLVLYDVRAANACEHVSEH